MVAAVLGAVIAITRPFHSFGGTGGTQSTTGGASRPSASTAPSTSRPSMTPAKTVLQAHVPAGFRQTCGTLSPDPAVLRAGLVVAVQCAPAQGKQGARTPEYTFYFQYSTADSSTSGLPRLLRLR
jgi:hypothetical protein